jgi:hypothetical protein
MSDDIPGDILRMARRRLAWIEDDLEREVEMRIAAVERCGGDFSVADVKDAAVSLAGRLQALISRLEEMS